MGTLVTNYCSITFSQLWTKSSQLTFVFSQLLPLISQLSNSLLIPTRFFPTRLMKNTIHGGPLANLFIFQIFCERYELCNNTK